MTKAVTDERLAELVQGHEAVPDWSQLKQFSAEILGCLRELQELRSALTARERQLAVANKLWQLCVKEDFPWADGSTQDALTELGLLYAKDMTDEDPSERCKNCDDDCSTCYRAVERIEDAAMEKANG